MGDIVEFSRSLNLSPVNFLLLVALLFWARWITYRHMKVWDWMQVQKGKEEERRNNHGGPYEHDL